jgi:uncharacterized protein YbjT (DUF2867 family)
MHANYYIYALELCQVKAHVSVFWNQRRHTMFVIAGITGNTGAAAAEALLAAGHKVRGIVRDKGKAKAWADRGVELVVADMYDAAALTAAFKGAEGAYALSPPDYSSADPIGRMQAVADAVREAVKASGIPRLVFLSSEAAHLDKGTGPIRGLHLAEGILAEVAPHTTFLRASYFQENWKSVFGLAAAQGIMPSMLRDLDAKRSMIATRDIGREAAKLLLEKAPPTVVELESAQHFSPKDAAEAMSSVLGKPVVPVQPPREQWEGILTGAGLSVAFAGLIAEMNDGINSGHVVLSGKGEARTGKTTLSETIASWQH